MTREQRINELVEIFLEKPYHIRQGAGYLSNLFNCDKGDIYEVRRIIKEQQKEADEREQRELELPKILIVDIETSPLKAYVWTIWKQNVYLDQLVSDWFMLTWSAKWLYGDVIYSDKLTADEVNRENDKRIVERLWKLLDEADMVIAHNGDKFDIPRINARFVENGLNPPSPYRQIDTKKVAKSVFGFSSNKLEALARKFGIDGKLDTDFTLWSRCMEGDENALEEMRTYNDHDVEILEDIYLIMRSWIKSHPNVGLYMDTDEPVCPHCGSKNVHEESKSYYTNTGKYDTYRCNDCKAVSRKRKSTLSNIKTKNLLVPIPK